MLQRIGIGVCLMSSVSFTQASDTLPADTRRATSGPERRDDKPYEVIKGEGFAVAIPRGWRDFQGRPPRMVLFRQGDGIGVPALDDTGSPLQIGITIEKYPGTKQTLDEGVEALTRQAKSKSRLAMIGTEKIERLKLADGSEARLLITEFIKESSRRSLQFKLLVKDGSGNGWVCSAFLVGGKESKTAANGSPIADALRLHLLTFCLDPSRINTASLDAGADASPATRPSTAPTRR